MNRRHSFSSDRHSHNHGPSQHNHNASSNRPGVLRQFQPRISDAWLPSGQSSGEAVRDADSSTLRRIATTRPLSSGGGLLSEARRSVARPAVHAAPHSRSRHTPIDPTAHRSALAASSSSSLRLVCPECLVSHANYVALRAHMLKAHLDPTVLLTCPHCSESIKHMTNLHRHIRVSLIILRFWVSAVFFFFYHDYYYFWKSPPIY